MDFFPVSNGPKECARAQVHLAKLSHDVEASTTQIALATFFSFHFDDT